MLFYFIYRVLVSIVSKLLLGLIRIYQLCISPFFPSSCRYRPTCSQYAVIAINRYGIIRGLFIALKRILRCHPFGGHGYDPVP